MNGSWKLFCITEFKVSLVLVFTIIETLQSSLIPMSTGDSKATNGIIFGLTFGIGIPVIVLGLAIILVIFKYQYHKKQAKTNWYAHNNQLQSY